MDGDPPVFRQVSDEMLVDPLTGPTGTHLLPAVGWFDTDEPARARPRNDLDAAGEPLP